MPARLPLFPLNVVLFPGTPLPLHIFEPRYRALLADCLEDDGRFGLTPVGTTEERPAPGAVGCRARVRVNQPTADGRSNIVVVGETRFVLVRYLDEPQPYCVGLVEPFEDHPGATVPDDQIDRLRTAFAAYVEAMRTLNDAGPDEFTWSDEPASFSFQVSATVEFDPTLKQRLLEMRAPAERVETLLQHLPRLATEAAAAAAVHVRARTNGKGGTPPVSTA